MRTSIILTVTGILLLTSVAAFSAAPPLPATAASGAPTVTHHVVESFDGTPIAVTVLQPGGATAADPVPVILHSHGWSGSRAKTATGMAGALVEAGFGVVSFDARGHGESGSVASVHHKDTETKDTILLLDWIHDSLDWVQKEPGTGIEKDLVAGAAGYSYGGGYQLMAASYDRRLDALAPEITWSHLPDALAPQGVPKSVWLDALVGLAYQSGTRMDPRIPQWYQAVLLTNEVPADALAHFEGSSPVLADIEADVLLIQGIPDVLFNLNHALRNDAGISGNGHGNDVRLWTHLTGHVLPTQPLGTTLDRLMPNGIRGPCGDTYPLVVAWMDEKLRDGPASGIPRASYALDDGECLELDHVPTDLTTVTLPALAAPSLAGTVTVPLLQGPALLAGTPHLKATVSPAATPTTTFAGLAILGADGYVRVLDDQTQPIRIAPGATIDLDLVAVAGRLHEGDTLLLRLDGANEWYAHNGARTPGLALLTDIQVALPLVDA